MKIDIRTEKREGGVLWFTPYRRIFPFIWTQWFRHPNGIGKIAVSSDDLDLIKEFIREQDSLNTLGKSSGVSIKQALKNMKINKKV